MPNNNDMGASYTDVVIDVGKKQYKRHKGKVITSGSLGTVVVAMIALGINPIDFAIETSSVYKDLLKRVEIAEVKVEHMEHFTSNQNILLRIAYSKGEITMEDLLKRIHKEVHTVRESP